MMAGTPTKGHPVPDDQPLRGFPHKTTADYDGFDDSQKRMSVACGLAGSSSSTFK
jgi:hypothetical protein